MVPNINAVSGVGRFNSVLFRRGNTFHLGDKCYAYDEVRDKLLSEYNDTNDYINKLVMCNSTMTSGLPKGTVDTVFILSAAGGYMDVLKYVCENYDITDYLECAVEQTAIYANLEAMKYLIDKYELNGSTILTAPLVVASEKGYLGMVMYLVSVNADVTHADSLCSQLATANNHKAVYDYLHTQGSDKDNKYKQHHTIERETVNVVSIIVLVVIAMSIMINKM